MTWLDVLRSSLGLAVSTILICSVARADRYFTGLPDAGTANWNNGANWSATAGGPGGAGAPGPLDITFVTDADPLERNVALDANATIAGLRIANSGGGISTLHQLDGFDLTTPFEALGEAYGDGTASLGAHVQSGGTNRTGELRIGDGIPSYGIYTLNDGTLTATGSIFVGFLGNGEFRQNGGWVSGALDVGRATYELKAGNLMSSHEQIAHEYRSNSTFTQSGGTNIVGTPESSGTALGIGEGGYSSGTFILNGGGASLIVYGGELLGFHGHGTFIQSAGSHVIHGELSLGQSFGGGAFNLSGGSLTVLGRELVGVWFGGSFVQTGGTHAVGTVSANQDLTVGGAGLYTLDGASAVLLVYGNEQVGDPRQGFGGGSFVQSDGVHSVSGSLRLGEDTLTQSRFILSGGRLDVANNEVIGNYGQGTFIQSGGLHSINNTVGSLSLAASICIGDGTAGIGSYWMHGGTLAVNGRIAVGVNGAGTFDQTSGVVKARLGLGDGTYRSGTTGVGTYLLRGGTLSASDIGLGGYGVGTFIQSGGVNACDNLVLGCSSVSTSIYGKGYYRLDDGTLTADYIRVGYNGSGTFIQNGGTVTVNGLWVSNRSAAPLSSYYLASPGMLHELGSASIGQWGPATFTQAGGVHQVDGILQIGVGGSGYYVMQDGTLTAGTIQFNTGRFVQNGGTVHTQNSFEMGSFSSLYEKSAGTLVAAQILNQGTFVHSGGTINCAVFDNTGTAIIGGIQDWMPGSVFTNGGFATFNTDAGAINGKRLTLNTNGRQINLASTQHLAELNINDGAEHTVVNVLSGEKKVLNTNALTISGGSSPTSVLDLFDNDLIVDYTGVSPFATIASQVRAGFNGGLWNGSGITSTSAAATPQKAALGIAEAIDVGARVAASFSGESIDSTCVLVRYTYWGDANLDGQVDVTDLGHLATNWQTAGHWTDGDFNYDGSVDVTDLSLLANNWQSGVSNPLGSAASFEVAMGMVGLGGIAVPEPSAITLIFALSALLSWVFIGRRRSWIFAAVLAIDCASSVARADRYFMGLPSGGTANWSNGINWSATAAGPGGAGAPGAADVAFIQDNDALNRGIKLDVSATTAGLWIFNSGGGASTLDQPVGFNLATPYEYLGDPYSFGDPSLGMHTQTGGVNRVNELRIGNGFRATGAYTISDGTLATDHLYVGYRGFGTFVQNGGFVSGETYIAAPDRSGSYTLNAGTFSGTLHVAEDYRSVGTFLQTGGSSTLSGLYLGKGDFCQGTYILSGQGASLTADGELLGFHGDGTFIQSAGMHVVNGYLWFGASGGKGFYQLDGGTLIVRGGEVIGDSVGGVFVHTGGTHVVGNTESRADLKIGYQGSYTLEGATAALTVWGNELIGSGEFVHSDGAHLVYGSLSLGDDGGSTGYYTLSGGSLTVGGEQLIGRYGSGTFSQTGGRNSPHAMVVGYGDGALGSYTISAGSLNVETRCTVGFAGLGSFTQNGGNVAVAEELSVFDLYGGHGAGTYTLNNGTLTTPKLTIVGNSYAGGGGGTFIYSGGVLNVGTLSVAGHLSVTQGSHLAPMVHGLQIDNTTGKLDLTDNNLIVDYTGPIGSLLEDVRDDLQDGALLTSCGNNATRLGYGDNAILKLSKFNGITIDLTSLLIKFTYAGDSNLDGEVDVTDLGRLATNWQTAGHWTDGDFNYDGNVDVMDLSIVANNWQAGINGSSLGAASFHEALASLGLPLTAVPEPATTCGSATLLALALSSRRRRRGTR